MRNLMPLSIGDDMTHKQTNRSSINVNNTAFDANKTRQFFELAKTIVFN